MKSESLLTESQIAKENIKLAKLGTIASNYKCQEHKTSCQRFLEDTHLWLNTQDKVLFKDIQKKREDRKDTIKLYEESGI